MKVIILNSHDVEKDKDVILDNIKEDAVFVVEHEMHLYQYIEVLNLSSTYQMQIKICKELKGLDVLQKYTDEDGIHEKEIHSFSDLLRNLNMDVQTFVIVRGDVGADEQKIAEVRSQVSDIVQQLIYLNFSLKKIQVMSEKESRSIEEIKRFEQHVQQHIAAIEKSKSLVSACADDEHGYRQKIQEHVENIRGFLRNAVVNELKIAVAASKKSGKSVVVNSMIEQELAPTSLELPTPNNCIYRRVDGARYTLDYDKNHEEFTSGEDIKERIRVLFKGEGKIPDMHIGYPSNQSGFMQYTVYDTPGPDIGTADKDGNYRDHMAAAERAIKEVDVIVFTIDYSKHLIQSELDYLIQIKEAFDKQHKNYSLIININKLDLRYDSEESNKNTVRILDFIKQELIKRASGFEGCIVTGTSALTYYNAIAAPQIHRLADCAVLLEEDFRDNLEDIIDAYAGEPEMTILSQLDTMVRKARNHHKLRLNSLEEVKEFSGMPNMLEYVRYVAVNKARAEKLNALMYRIAQEYAMIQNLFHFKELEEALMANQEKLAEARRILKKFRDEIERIYSKKNADLFEMRENHPEKFRSTALGKLSEKYPVYLEELGDIFGKWIAEDFSVDDILESYTESTLKSRIRGELQNLYSKSEKRRDGKKVVPISEVIGVYQRIGNGLSITEDLSLELTSKRDRLIERYKKEYTDIAENLVDLFISRRDALLQAIHECKEELHETCDIDIIIEIPTIPPDYPVPDMGKVRISIGTSMVNTKFDKFKDYSVAKDAGWFRSLIDHIMGNYNLIYLEDAMRIYDKEEFGKNIRKDIREHQNVKKAFEFVIEKMNALVAEIIARIVSDMNTSCQMAENACMQITETLDHTEDYEAFIRKIEERKVLLKQLEASVAPFVASWNE